MSCAHARQIHITARDHALVSWSDGAQAWSDQEGVLAGLGFADGIHICQDCGNAVNYAGFAATETVHQQLLAQDEQALRARANERPFASGSLFIQEIRRRAADGHKLVPSDNPLARMLGYVDTETDEWVLITISALKRTMHELDETTRTLLMTPAGRKVLVGGGA